MTDMDNATCYQMDFTPKDDGLCYKDEVPHGIWDRMRLWDYGIHIVRPTEDYFKYASPSHSLS